MSRQVGLKLRDLDFLKIISEVNFIGLGETHVHDENHGTSKCLWVQTYWDIKIVKRT